MSLAELGVLPPKGFRDILPRETVIRDHLLRVIVETYRAYGFERIETAAVEDLRRLRHSEGGENLGLIFKILKRGEKLDVAAAAQDPDSLADLALRYDLTVPLARFFANNRGSLPPVFKAIQVGPVWRAERPQQGRYRQFTQCDIDVIGGSSPQDEIELITVTLDALGRLGLTGATTRVNDRRILLAMCSKSGILEEETGRALVSLDKLDKVGLTGVEELLHKDGIKPAAIVSFMGIARRIAAAAPEGRLEEARRELDGPDMAGVFDSLAMLLEAVQPGLKNGSSVVFDPFLVRGMGYYTGPVFEIGVKELTFSLAGGGRYDNLIGKLSGVDATACGFSIGFERLVAVLEERMAAAASGRKVAVLYDRDGDPLGEVLMIVQDIQRQGGIASMFAAPKNVKAMLDRLKQAGYTELVRFKRGEPPLSKPLQ